MKPYYDNSHLCGNCNGDGCRVCDCKGVTRWPLSQTLQLSFPPSIKQPNANVLVRVLEKQSYKPSDSDYTFRGSRILFWNKQAIYKGYN